MPDGTNFLGPDETGEQESALQEMTVTHEGEAKTVRGPQEIIEQIDRQQAESLRYIQEQLAAMEKVTSHFIETGTVEDLEENVENLGYQDLLKMFGTRIENMADKINLNTKTKKHYQGQL